MSINIPSKHINLAKSLKITYDLTRFGKVQKKRLVAALRHGVVTGAKYSVPAKLAVNIRNNHDMPSIVIYDNQISWNKINKTNEKFFGLMDAAAVAIKATVGNDSYYASVYLEQVRKREHKGYMWGIVPELLQRIAAETALETSPSVNKLADDIENGTVLELELDVSGHGHGEWMF